MRLPSPRRNSGSPRTPSCSSESGRLGDDAARLPLQSMTTLPVPRLALVFRRTSSDRFNSVSRVCFRQVICPWVFSPLCAHRTLKYFLPTTAPPSASGPSSEGRYNSEAADALPSATQPLAHTGASLPSASDPFTPRSTSDEIPLVAAPKKALPKSCAG